MISAENKKAIVERAGLHVVLSGGAILWRAVLGRWRGVGGELRSLSDSEGSVSVCGEPVSPTISRRNLNLDRKSCHTTYHPAEETERSASFNTLYLPLQVHRFAFDLHFYLHNHRADLILDYIKSFASFV